MTKKNSKKNAIQIQVENRKLGDEWAEWDGCLDDEDVSIDAGKRLFFGFSLLALLLLSGGAMFIWYLIQPRIEELSSALAYILGMGILGSMVLLFFWVFLNFLSMILEKNLLLRIFRFEFSLTFLAPLVVRLGNRFGISKDKMFNSFIKVSNSLTLLAKSRLTTPRLLVLLPHCLQHSIRKNLMELGEKYKIGIYVASGGTLARKIIREQRPKAVVAIACERDLILGIRDIFLKIPVIGIPNRRPEGPCKNTIVDFNEVENAIKFFLYG